MNWNFNWIIMKNRMRKFLKGILTLFLFVHFVNAQAKVDYLESCWNKQVKGLNGSAIEFSFTEKVNELEHNFEPWQQTNYSNAGLFWISKQNFLKNDTLTNISNDRKFYSKTQFINDTLIYLDYGDKDLFPVSQSMNAEQVFKSIRYSPINLINYFIKRKITEQKGTDKIYAVYKTEINNVILELFIRKSDFLIEKIITLSNDETLGDVQNTYTYLNYVNKENVFFSSKVNIEKINGKVKDIVDIKYLARINDLPKLLNQPADYIIKTDLKTIPEVSTEKFSDNIFLVSLKHTNDKVLVVEFKDFILVGEAPLNSENGELIIKEANKIAPNKQIRYFVFGHFHPHYIGGVRAFVNNGAKIMCSKSDEEYVNYLVNSNHSINPDSLQLHPTKLQLESIENHKSISDGEYTMEIYFIGKKSKHTNDYLIYYFPNEKVLFEDDLVWIKSSGAINKAGDRQLGLYNSIKELNLDVKTIIQSWPVSDYGVKTIIPFSDMEESVK